MHAACLLLMIYISHENFLNYELRYGNVYGTATWR